ncbi:unnamed protein product [Caenorhabditis bovis]|uniref:Uncharacterized protein n=1 Tax=Caenorhabditis bovis TaxID=2654633 RepID=A0A8S1FBJ4_9PELO|nr:unnamed protein product [Caenorhabditis bovis]
MLLHDIQELQNRVEDSKSNENEYPKTLSAISDAYIFCFAIFLGHHYFTNIFAGILVFCVERTFASFLITDYEQHPRSYISAILVTISTIVTMFISAMTLTDFFSIIAILAMTYGIVTLLLIIYALVYFYNYRLHHKITRTNSNDMYSLAFRYQLRENLKAFKLARQIVAILSGFGALNVTLLCAVYLNVIPIPMDIVVHSVEHEINLSPLLFCAVVIVSFNEWTKAFSKRLSRCRFIQFFHLSVSKATVQPARSEETELYFMQLQNYWL